MDSVTAHPDAPHDEAAIMRKGGVRLVPFLMLCSFIAYIDRINAGFAALTMNHDVGLSRATFGIGGAARLRAVAA